MIARKTAETGLRVGPVFIRMPPPSGLRSGVAVAETASETNTARSANPAKARRAVAPKPSTTAAMSLDLDQIVAGAQAAFAAANDNATLENEKARFLGKTGALTELLKSPGKLDPEARKSEGARINRAKQQVEAALNGRRRRWPMH